jgi:type I restriction enzyme M protein
MAFFYELKKLDIDLSHDVLRDYYQTEHGDRDRLKQDYTPDRLCELIHRLTGDGDTLDICLGTGALTIAQSWTAEHRCEEISERALPILLLNLAIRGMSASVAVKDVLTNVTKAEYRIEPAGEYSRITKGSTADRKWPLIVSNPPYSLRFTGADGSDPRWIYGVTPTQYSDLLFVQDALSHLDDDGMLIEILPHEVLFCGKKEGEIRRKMLEAGVIDTVIELPPNLFMNIGIPVLIMILRKHRASRDVLVIDAQDLCVKFAK